MNCRYFALAWLTVRLAAPAAPAGGAGPPEVPRELFHYHMDAGLSAVAMADLSVADDGRVLGRVRRASEPREHLFRLRLTADEIEALKTIVRITGFFSQPGVIPDTGPAHGHETVAAAFGGKRHEVSWGYAPHLHPISTFAWSILQQGLIVDDLKTRPELALEELSAAMGGVLRPRALREPLEAALRDVTEPYRYASGWQALVAATTPTEYLGYVGSELERCEDTARLRVLANAANTRDRQHALAVAPLLFRELDGLPARWSKLSYSQQAPYERVIELMGEVRYYEARPVLLDLLESGAGSSSGADAALVRLGRDVIPPVVNLLNHADAKVRADALDVLRGLTSVSAQPTEIVNRPVDERRLTLRLVRSAGGPTIRRLRETDPDPDVREAARQACLALALPFRE